MLYLSVFIISLVMALLVSPMAISLCYRWELLDHPDSRKLHDTAMPLAGGLILFPFVFTGALISFPASGTLPYILVASSLVFALGVWDDRFGAHFSTKFLVQIVAALLVMQSGLLFDLNKVYLIENMGLEFGHFFSMAVTLLWIVGITNAVNIIDGMDGLAAGLSLNAFVGIGALTLIMESSGLALFCVVMSGALLGFLRFNIFPAKTFLGDSGSMLLGFILAVISIVKSTKTTTFLIVVVPAVLLALPMLDTVWAFVRRGIHGRNPFKADRGHLHHRLLDLKFTQKQVLGLFFSLSTGLGILALEMVQIGRAYILVLAVCLLILALVTIKAMQVYNLHDLVQRMNSRMREMARRAVQKEPSGEERLVTNFMILAGICVLNLFIVIGPGQENLVFTMAALGIFALGLMDVYLNLGEGEGRYEIIHVVLFLSLVVNQLAVLAFWHRHYLVAPHFAASAFIVLILLAVFIYRTGTFAVFLQDPMEILALYIGVVVCGLAKHFLHAPAVLPFAVALANALVLYTLLKIYLSGYRMRSWTRSLGFASCVGVLVSVPWWV